MLMRKWINLSESLFYKGPFKPRYGDGVDEIVILKNPTRREVERLRAASQYGDVRGLLDNDLYVWDAELATHSEVAETLKIDGSDLHMEPDYVTVNDCPPDFTDEEAHESASWIKNHAAMKAIYGEDFRLFLEAPDAGKEWNF